MSTTFRDLVLLYAEHECTCESCGQHAQFVLQYRADDGAGRELCLCRRHLQELAVDDTTLLTGLMNSLALQLEQTRIMILA